eukprot:1859599-Amphidinium_carterae.1
MEKGMKNDVWEIGPLWPVGQHPPSQYRNCRLVQKHCEFQPRSNMACSIGSDGFLYLSGGRPCQSSSAGLFNDLWRSKDGVSWELVCSTCPWAARHSHVTVACTRAPGVLLLLAGQGQQVDGGWQTFNDVWQFDRFESHDGPSVGGSWRCLTKSAGWGPRIQPSVRLGHDCDIVLAGGEVVCPQEKLGKTHVHDAGADLLADVWQSSDGGVTWTQ